MDIAGLILGILSTILSFMGVGLIFGIIGIPISIKGFFKAKKENRSSLISIIGIILNSIGLGISILFILFFAIMIFSNRNSSFIY